MAKSNYIVRGGGDFSGLYKELDKAQKQMGAFKNGISKTMRTIGSILGTLAIGKLVKDSTQAAMSVESSIENINRNMRDSAGQYQKWAETQSQALGIAKKDAYSYGSTFSNLLSSFTSGSKETADQTTELMNATAIIASKTGRTFDDTANRIRSGMLGSTEAIEDLGIYTNISMIESTNAFRQFAGDSSWAQLDFQTQQQIRLAAILEQTYARYGNTLADTTQTRHAIFIASLQNIQLALGQAFLPIYNAVLPALTTMANAIGRVINYIAQFVTALFGSAKAIKPMTQQTQALGGAVGGMQDLGDATKGAGNAAKKAGKAAKKAGKEAKGVLMGFDEINKLSMPDTSDSGGTSDPGGSGAGGGGGIGGMDMPGLDFGGFADSTLQVSERIQAMADKIKKTLNDLKAFFEENKAAILSTVAGLAAGIGAYFLITNWPAIVGVVKTALAAIGTAFSSISWPIVAISALIGLFVGTLVNLWLTNEEFRNKVTDAWNGIVSVIKNLWDTVLKPILVIIGETLMDIWNDAIKPLWEKWKAFVAEIVYLTIDMWNAMKPVLNWIIKNFGPGIVQIFKGVAIAVGAAIKLVINIVGSIIQAFTGIIRGVRQIFSGLIQFITGVFTGDWRKAWNGIKTIFSGVGTVISSVGRGIMGVFGNIISFVKTVFTSGWRSAWNGIKTIFSSVFNSLKSIAVTPLNWIISAINSMIRGLNRFSIKVPSWVSKLAGVQGGTFGFNISQIPHLAKGGITNGEMLAVVGDNPGGREVVSPLDTLQSMLVDSVSTALAQTGNKNDNGGGDLEISLELDNAKLGKAVIKNFRQITKQTGRNPVLSL